jgi:hypothetical protein
MSGSCSNMADVKVGYAIWNRRKQFQANIEDVLIDLDFALDSIIVPYVNADCNAILNHMADFTDFTHVVIYASGTGLRRSYALDSYWHDHCQKPWMISGHILMHNEDQYPNLHEQAFAINLSLWKLCGRPQLGYREKGIKHLVPFTRSNQNIHDDYTPRWLQPSHSPLLHTDQRKFGWNIISKSLEHGFRVVNVPINIREQKFYIYPEDDGQKLVKAVSQVRSNHDAMVEPFENETQEKFIEWLRHRLKQAKTPVFLFNTGVLWFEQSYIEIKADSLWTTASGFKSFVEWYMRGASAECRIDTYDYNSRSLNVWRHIHANWQGSDLYSFMKDYDPNIEIEEEYCWGNKLAHETFRQASNRQEQEIVDYFGDRENMIKHWKIFQGLFHCYHHCNLVTGYHDMVRHLEPNKTHFIWINNIFFFRQNILQYGLNYLNTKLCDFVDDIAVQAPNTYVFGQCSKFYFGHRVDDISAEIKRVPEHRHQWDMDNHP